MDKYLRTANGVIEECQELSGPEHFDTDTEAYRRSERRADSGVSFATGDRPSTSSSTGSRTHAATTNKPLPASPEAKITPIPPTPKKRGTTLEKIAREFRNLRTRNDVKELTTSNNEATEPKARTLKKMKSTSSIGGTKAKHSRKGSDEPVADFKIGDAQRQRMIWEAQKEKENRAQPTLGVRGKQRSFDLEL